jgi:hypothetical protein
MIRLCDTADPSLSDHGFQETSVASPPVSCCRASAVCAIRLMAATLLAATAVSAQATGNINGRVVDQGARPIAGARIELRPALRRVVSDEAGRFEFRNVEPGNYSLSIQRIGYQPVTSQVNVTVSNIQPTIVLISIPQVLDSVLVRERAAPNRFSATVLDDIGLPVSEVSVTIEGINNMIRTDSSGHFVVPKQVHGTIMIRMRKIGYAAYFGSLRMIASRDDTLRMSRLAQGLSPVQITEASGFGGDTFAYKELDQRMRWRDQRSAVISREELDQMGRLNLCTALPFTPTGSRYNVNRGCGGCVILNGESSLSLPAVAYYADQVEMVEYYPPGSDVSGSLEARGCGRRSSTLVIWLRKDPNKKP